MDDLFPKNEGGGLRVQGDGTAVAVNQSVFPRRVNVNKLAGSALEHGKGVVSPMNLTANVAFNPFIMEKLGARIHQGEPIPWGEVSETYLKDLTWDVFFGGMTAAALKKVGPLGIGLMVKPVYSGVDAYVKGATGTSITERNQQRLIDRAPFSDKRIKEMGLADISEYNLPRGPAEIKQWNPNLLDRTKMRIGDFFNRY